MGKSWKGTKPGKGKGFDKDHKGYDKDHKGFDRDQKGFEQYGGKRKKGKDYKGHDYKGQDHKGDKGKGGFFDYAAGAWNGTDKCGNSVLVNTTNIAPDIHTPSRSKSKSRPRGRSVQRENRLKRNPSMIGLKNFRNGEQNQNPSEADLKKHTTFVLEQIRGKAQYRVYDHEFKRDGFDFTKDVKSLTVKMSAETYEKMYEAETLEDMEAGESDLLFRTILIPCSTNVAGPMYKIAQYIGSLDNPTETLQAIEDTLNEDMPVDSAQSAHRDVCDKLTREAEDQIKERDTMIKGQDENIKKLEGEIKKAKGQHEGDTKKAMEQYEEMQKQYKEMFKNMDTDFKNLQTRFNEMNGKFQAELASSSDRNQMIEKELEDMTDYCNRMLEAAPHVREIVVCRTDVAARLNKCNDTESAPVIPSQILRMMHEPQTINVNSGMFQMSGVSQMSGMSAGPSQMSQAGLSQMFGNSQVSDNGGSQLNYGAPMPMFNQFTQSPVGWVPPVAPPQNTNIAENTNVVDLTASPQAPLQNMNASVSGKTNTIDLMITPSPVNRLQCPKSERSETVIPSMEKVEPAGENMDIEKTLNDDSAITKDTKTDNANVNNTKVDNVKVDHGAQGDSANTKKLEDAAAGIKNIINVCNKIATDKRNETESAVDDDEINQDGRYEKIRDRAMKDATTRLEKFYETEVAPEYIREVYNETIQPAKTYDELKTIIVKYLEDASKKSAGSSGNENAVAAKLTIMAKAICKACHWNKPGTTKRCDNVAKAAFMRHINRFKSREATTVCVAQATHELVQAFVGKQVVINQVEQTIKNEFKIRAESLLDRGTVWCTMAMHYFGMRIATHKETKKPMTQSESKSQSKTVSKKNDKKSNAKGKNQVKKA